jgi:hypothetical protein
MRRETQRPIRSKQALARDRNAEDQRRDGGNSPIRQFSPQNTALGKIIREKRRSHGTPGVRVSASGPVRAGGLDLSRHQSRFVSIGQPAARRHLGLIRNDPARRIARQRRAAISIFRTTIGIHTLRIKYVSVCCRKEI